MSDGDGILGAVKSEAGAVAKEIKQQVTGSTGQSKKSTSQISQDPRLAQLEQQDKFQSTQREAAIKKELEMISHQNANNLGVMRERPQPQQPEQQLQKPQMSAPFLPGSKNRNPLDTQFATTKRELRDNKVVG